jgi:hypothetical protein|tara:strand:+ start:314 stop:913 length:600 start_codon:yes stop_codon:yes gene_type:complete
MKTQVRQNITQKLSVIQTTLKAPKNRTNSFGKYKYRAAEDILEAVKPMLAELQCSLLINEELISAEGGLPIMKSIATLVDSNDATKSVSAVALVGVDLNSKGMQKPQQFGAASSYGKKYALGNLFLLDDTQDSDATNNHKTIKNIAVKASFTEQHPQFQKTIEWLAKGGDISIKMKTLTDKYSITKDLQEKLTNLTVKN